MSREEKATLMKLAAGSIRQRSKNGCFAYRCQVNGRRTEISLQTKDYHEALKKVAELVPIAQAIHGNKAENFLWDELALAHRGETSFINEPYVTAASRIHKDTACLKRVWIR